MLLLSSATRILATGTSSNAPTHTVRPHKTLQPHSIIGALGAGSVNANWSYVCRKGTCRYWHNLVPAHRNCGGKLPGNDFFQTLFLLASRFFLGIGGVVCWLGVRIGRSGSAIAGSACAVSPRSGRRRI